jgi:hypothetical protein
VRLVISEHYRRTRASIHVNDPAVTVVTHAPSATIERFRRREPAGLKISRTTIEVLAVAGTTNSCVRPWRAITTDDPERPSVACSKALEDPDERRVDATT